MNIRRTLHHKKQINEIVEEAEYEQEEGSGSDLSMHNEDEVSEISEKEEEDSEQGYDSDSDDDVLLIFDGEKQIN